MKLRQNKLVPLRLQEYVPQNAGNQKRFEEILEALNSIRLDWLLQTPYSPHSPQPRHSPQPHHHPDSKPATCDRPPSERVLGQHLANLPQKTLEDYSKARDQSLLSHVFRIAAHYQSHTDRVVFLGDAPSQSVIKSILYACCDPYWNHWTRGERGSKPRRFFAGESWDNDTHQAILEFFSDGRASNRREEFDWGVVRLIAPEGCQHNDLGDGQDMDPVASFATILKKLHAARHVSTSILPTHTDEDFWIECFPSGPISTASKAGMLESIPVIPSSLLTFTFCGLLPAAILGVNVMELLAGAHFISKQFFELDKSSNPILRWTAWQMIAQQEGIVRQLHYTNSTLEWGARWLLELNENRSWSHRKCDASSQPCSWVLCPPHHYHNSHDSQSDRDLWQCHLVVDSVRYDTLQAPDRPESNYREEMQRHIQRKLQKLGTANVSGLVLEFPIVDELAIGQWMQWMILSELLQAEMNSTVDKSANSGI